MSMHHRNATRCAKAISATGSTRHFPVFRAGAFRAIQGVNEGDPLADARELAYEDVYALTADARPDRLDLSFDPAVDTFRVSRDSDTGQHGARVILDCLLTFIGTAGRASEGLVFVEVDRDDTIADIYFHPLAPLKPEQGYTLVTIDRDGGRARLAEFASTGLTQGTRVAPANGAPRQAQALRTDDSGQVRDMGEAELVLP